MKERLELLRQEFEKNMAKATTLAELEAERIAFLGKKGHIAELMKGLRDVADKKAAGQLINTFKNEVEEAISEADEALRRAEIDRQIRSAKKYNPSLVYEKELGSYHPITLATREVEAVASAITPVPGGVGPMTITMLLRNTLSAAKAFAGKK